LYDWAYNYANYAGPSSVDQLDGYGCVCQGLDLDNKPSGKPVDDVDLACQAWRRCMGCAKKLVGEVCGRYRLTRDKSCGNQVGSYKRATCECDMALFESLKVAEFNKKNMNYDQDKCEVSVKNHGGGGHGECCQNASSGHFVFYNTNTHDCCTNGDVAPTGTC